MIGRAGGIAMAGALALCAATASCLGHLPPCPAAGGPAWTELQSAHFRLRTDAAPDDARRVVTDLEQFQIATLFIVGAPIDLDTGRVPVVLLDHGWTDFMPRQFPGYFTHALFQPLVVMMTESRLSAPTVVKHELIHYLSGMIMARQPPWLAEGLATFYETLEYDVEAGRVTVGRPSADRLRGARLLGASNIESILAAKTIDPDDTSRFYAAAWITTHYLMNHRIEALRGYERALRAGATPEQAWTAAFGTETPRQLALAVRQYLDGGRYELLVYGFKPGPLAAPTVRALSDADAHATRALLYVTGARAGAVAPALAPAPAQSKAAAQRELAEARRQEPAHVMAGAIAHFMLDAPVDADQAAAATRAHAGDWLAWMLFAEASRQRGDGAGWNDAVARAVETSRGDRSIHLPFVAIPRRL